MQKKDYSCWTSTTCFYKIKAEVYVDMHLVQSNVKKIYSTPIDALQSCGSVRLWNVLKQKPKPKPSNKNVSIAEWLVIGPSM